MGRPKKYVGLDKNEVRQLHYRRKIEEFKTLLGAKCAQCGATEDLEFDHIDPDSKSFNISSRATLRRETVLAELAKCQLLCPACHEDKTFADRGSRAHGTPAMYNTHGCRCTECRAYRHREYIRSKERRQQRNGAV